MVNKSSWRLDKAKLDYASSFGEEIIKTFDISSPPIDPFHILESEKRHIRAFGDDFKDAFDGRLEYNQSIYLLFYNTKYNSWPHSGLHHPKVRFTVSHELGHYFLEAHREYLRKGGQSHYCVTDFVSDNLIEREADCFAAGLLMPEFMLREVINKNTPNLSIIKDMRNKYDVSLTSMMVRWTQICDFPCAVLSVKQKNIQWSFTSEGFKRDGGFWVRRGAITSESALDFVNDEPTFKNYREGSGWGRTGHWLDIKKDNVDVHEDYVVIPSTETMIIFLTTKEEDLFDDLD